MLLMVAVAGGLIYLGIVIYPPIHNAIMGLGNISSNGELPYIDDPYLDEAQPDEQEQIPARRPAQALRAVYAPPTLLGDAAALDAFLDSLPGAGLNAVMVDIKDRQGHVLHRTQNQNAIDWEAVAPDAFDLAGLSSRLEDRGLSLIVRMQTFRDAAAAGGNPDYAVQYRAPGTRWFDNFPGAGGRPWLNPHSEGARQYITDLALEAVELGAVMVVLDDFQFPTNSLTQDAYFGDTQGLSRAERLRQFADELTEILDEQGARLAVHMTSVSLASEPNLTLFGGPAADILSGHTLLSALPYQFPFGFAAEGLELQNPLENLDYTLTQIVSHATQLTESGLIVLLQGGSLPGGVQYTDEQIRAQSERLAQLGVREFIFYSPHESHYQLAG